MASDSLQEKIDIAGDSLQGSQVAAVLPQIATRLAAGLLAYADEVGSTSDSLTATAVHYRTADDQIAANLRRVVE